MTDDVCPEAKALTEHLEKKLIQFFANELSENVAFSTANLLILLAAVLQGAEPETAKEHVLKPLGIDVEVDAVLRAGAELTKLADVDGFQSALAAFCRSEPLPTFSSALKSKFGALLIDVSTAPPARALKLANDFIESNTEVRNQEGSVELNGIKDFIQPDAVEDVQYLLVSCLTTSAKWIEPFEEEQTKPRTFVDATGAKAKSLMMSATKDEAFFGFDRDRGLASVRLPLRNGASYEFYVGDEDADEEQRVDAFWALMLEPDFGLDFHQDKCFVMVPKSSVSSTSDPVAVFGAMGVNWAELALPNVDGGDLRVRKGGARTDSKRDEYGGSTASVAFMNMERSRPASVIVNAPHVVRLLSPSGVPVVTELVAFPPNEE